MKGLFSKIAAACLLAATAQTGSAQFYVGLNAGYAFSTTNDLVGTNQTYDSNGRLTSSKAVHSTIGGGAPIQLNLGYGIKKYLRFDLGVTYFAGKNTTVNERTKTNETYSQKAQTMQIRLNPSIIAHAPMGEDSKLSPYARFGVVLPITGKTTSTTQTDGTAGSTTYSSTIVAESKGAVSLGFETGVGVAYMVNDNIGITGELSYTGLRIKAAKQTLTKYQSVTGAATVDVLATLNTYTKETEFQDELTAASNNPATATTIDTTKAKNDLAGTTNFSSLAIRVGVFYKFGGSKE